MNERTCEECKHSYRVPGSDGDSLLECRYNPPQLAVILVNHPLNPNGPPQLMKQSGFPNCMHPCGQFEEAPRMGLAS